MDKDLTNALKQLALSVKITIDNDLSKGVIKPEEEVFFRWRVDKFQYTDNGITDSSAHGEYITKPSWFRASLKLTEFIKKSNEFNTALEQITNVFGRADVLPQYLEHFVTKLVHECLYNSKFGEADIDALLETFVKDLREEPIKCGADIELQGIVLCPEKVEPSFGITIRQTKVEDLEKEVPVYGFGPLYTLPDPSAIMSIDFLGRGGPEIQKRVEKAITILRFFKVGSVRWTRYHLRSESIIGIAGGTLTSGKTTGALETYLVTQEDIPELKKFWQAMSDSIPENFIELGETKVNHLAVAYKRYNDALLENGLLERRIANAVMGLEALLLEAGEVQELPYRLGVRIGKLFSSLRCDPHEVRKIVNDAYKVRNLFAHGSQLSYERKKKLESKYKDVKNLLLSVLNYLRILIIVMIFIKQEKNEFIDLLDDSLIDKKREEILNGILLSAKSIVG